jgi:hypothetical protein
MERKYYNRVNSNIAQPDANGTPPSTFSLKGQI